MLIEALGQEFWYYDERRLESLISRLRRKLASYAPDGFPIRGVGPLEYLVGTWTNQNLSGSMKGDSQTPYSYNVMPLPQVDPSSPHRLHPEKLRLL